MKQLESKEESMGDYPTQQPSLNKPPVSHESSMNNLLLQEVSNNVNIMD